MAHLAEEDQLISAFNTVGPSGSGGQGIDPFTILAEQMDQKRADVKQLFYAVSYGMGSEQLSKKLGCDWNTAKRWKSDLLSKFPKVRTLSDASSRVSACKSGCKSVVAVSLCKSVHQVCTSVCMRCDRTPTVMKVCFRAIIA